MALGSGIVATWEGSTLVLRIEAGADAAKTAPHSSSGKTRLLATSHGALLVPGGLPGLKVALNVTLPKA
jgi:hypothetical protein